MDISDMREEFLLAGLEKEDLAVNPFDQFELWFKQATDANLPMQNGVSIATVDAEGQPSLRTVLLKFFDKDGFVFYTNYNSQKARDIANNNKVALLFYWPELQRQVKVKGVATKVSTAQSLKYFLSRPRGSQIGAWASAQSNVISSRQMLLSKVEEIKAKFKNKEIPLPEGWGGFRIEPQAIEFWQGRKSRLHDRFRYNREANNSWTIERLAP